MDLKSFVLGAVVGGLVTAGLSQLNLERQTSDDSIQSNQVASVDGGKSALSSSKTTRLTPPDEWPMHSSAEAQSDVRDTPAAVPQGDMRSHWFTARRDKLLQEPKDTGWSYFMEQAILQFLANHSAMTQFTVVFIECRTAICQVGIEAHTESAAPDWHRVTYDMRQQPWYEFDEVGMSSGEVNGRQMTVTELHKRSNE